MLGRVYKRDISLLRKHILSDFLDKANILHPACIHCVRSQFVLLIVRNYVRN